MPYPVTGPDDIAAVLGIIIIHLVALILIVLLCEWISRWFHHSKRCRHVFEGESFHDFECVKCGEKYSSIKHKQKADIYAESVAEKFSDANAQTPNAQDKPPKWRGRLR